MWRKKREIARYLFNSKWPAILRNSASAEDLEIARILNERHSKNTTKSTKTALKAFVKAAGNVAELQDKEVLDKS